MRLIAEDPDFTWDGTGFIIIAFTIFGLAQGIVRAVRARGASSAGVMAARVGGAVGMLPLFMGAGALMLPTVVGGGLAYARTIWRWPARALCLVVASGPVLFVTTDLVASFGWSVRTLVGVALMLAVYGTIIWAARGTFAPSRADRWPRVVRIALAALAVVLFAIPLASGGLQ
jgi:hypothetical protein